MTNKNVDFGQGGLLSFWNSLSVDDRNALVERLNEYHALITSLKARKLIEVDKHIREINIVKKDEDTDRLLELIKLINAPGITVTYKGKPIKK